MIGWGPACGAHVDGKNSSESGVTPMPSQKLPRGMQKGNVLPKKIGQLSFNTDAEGVFWRSLFLAPTEGPTKNDLGLTGACMVARGPISGLMGR
ncbi:MAG: hypothetical protein CM15mP49_11200 [Actinomycetota bacterium]|nr:MAG: hypothetical protein CM15mP49_11200 [Actinomycetota bacterium]